MKTQKGNTLLIVLVVVLVLTILGAAGAYWYFIYNKNAASNTYVPMAPADKVTLPPEAMQQKDEVKDAAAIQNASEVDKLTDEVNSLQVDDTSENLSSSDTLGL